MDVSFELFMCMLIVLKRGWTLVFTETYKKTFVMIVAEKNVFALCCSNGKMKCVIAFQWQSILSHSSCARPTEPTTLTAQLLVSTRFVLNVFIHNNLNHNFQYRLMCIV